MRQLNCHYWLQFSHFTRIEPHVQLYLYSYSSRTAAGDDERSG
jgi:hypothetical protein